MFTSIYLRKKIKFMKCRIFFLTHLLCFPFFLFSKSQDESEKKESSKPTAYPRIENGANVWLSADFIYWKASEDGLAFTNEISNVLVTNDFTQTQVINPSIDWAPGFRIGAGYQFPNPPWHVFLEWTHICSSVSGEAVTGGDIFSGMFPIWSLSKDLLKGDFVYSASMNGKIRTDLLDLMTGREVTLVKWFSFRPRFGIRAAFIRQHYNVEYLGGSFGGENPVSADEIKLRNSYWGVGPLAGFDPQFILGKGISLFGLASGSFLLGEFFVKEKETYLLSQRGKIVEKKFRLRGTADFAAGLRWTQYLYKKRFALTFQGGWEYHIFFNQNQLREGNFSLLSKNDNLIYKGWFLSSRFDF
jgi:hypothetical protein